MEWPDEQRLKVSREVLSKVLDDEAVLLDLGSGTYFGLNRVGTKVWEILGEGATVRELREQIVATFEVDPEVAAQDLAELLEELEQRGLIELCE